MYCYNVILLSPHHEAIPLRPLTYTGRVGIVTTRVALTEGGAKGAFSSGGNVLGAVVFFFF